MATKTKGKTTKLAAAPPPLATPKAEGAPTPLQEIDDAPTGHLPVPPELWARVTRNGPTYFLGDRELSSEEAERLLDDAARAPFAAVERRLGEGEPTNPPDEVTVRPPHLGPAPGADDYRPLPCPRCGEPSGWTRHDLRIYKATAHVDCAECGRSSEVEDLRAAGENDTAEKST